MKHNGNTQMKQTTETNRKQTIETTKEANKGCTQLKTTKDPRKGNKHEKYK